jgi:P4 family phage/plasmid primase-like protien
MAKLDYALDYAKQGWAVFPLHCMDDKGRCSCGDPACPHPGKHPLVTPDFKHGYLDATLDIDLINKTWAKYPQANIGRVLKGEVVIDQDNRHGGVASLAKLKAKYGPLPPTVTALTGSGDGSRHQYYLAPDDGGAPLDNILKIDGLDGLELKAKGYIIAVGSVTTKPYTWLEGAGPDEIPIAPLPSWLVELSRQPFRGEGVKEGKPKKQYTKLTKAENEKALAAVLESCAFLRHCAKDAATLSEPEWHGMVEELAFFGEPGMAKIHELSAPYPRYSEEATNKKIADAINAMEKKRLGPYTCAKIQRNLNFACPTDCLAKQTKTKTPVTAAIKATTDRQAKERPPTKSIVISTHPKTGKEEIRVVCPVLAEEIKERHLFKTMRDTEEVFYYDAGIYKPRGETIIRQDVAETLGDLAKRNHGFEVLWYIQGTTYTERADFDADPYSLNLNNGILNIQTMSLMPHTPSFLSTIRIPVNYDPNADCSTCKRFFQEVLEPQDIPLVEELFGYIFDPIYRYHKAFLFIGDGANAKTTLLGLLMAFANKTNCSSISLQELETNRFASANLWGKVANLYDDLPSKTVAHVGKFKMITGGSPLNAEFKFGRPFTFVNRAKVVFTSNQPPIIENEDSFAFWRRWALINCPNKFEGNRRDPLMLERLTTAEELSGLLNLALAGLNRLWAKGEFSHPQSADEVAHHYLTAANPIYAFLTDCCEPDVGAWVSTDDLYSAYVNYCTRKKIPILGRESFGRRLRDLPEAKDYSRARRGKPQVWGWSGLRLSTIPRDMQGDKRLEQTPAADESLDF